MKPDTEKALAAIHAQLGALMLQIESLMDEEISQECTHENMIDMSTFGMKPGERTYCPTCKKSFDNSEDQDVS